MWGVNVAPQCTASQRNATTTHGLVLQPQCTATTYRHNASPLINALPQSTAPQVRCHGGGCDSSPATQESLGPVLHHHAHRSRPPQLPQVPSSCMLSSGWGLLLAVGWEVVGRWLGGGWEVVERWPGEVVAKRGAGMPTRACMQPAGGWQGTPPGL